MYDLIAYRTRYCTKRNITNRQTLITLASTNSMKIKSDVFIEYTIGSIICRMSDDKVVNNCTYDL